MLAGYYGRRRHAGSFLLDDATLRGRRGLGRLARDRGPRHLFGLRSGGDVLELGALLVLLVVDEGERLNARLHRLDAVRHVHVGPVIVVILLRAT